MDNSALIIINNQVGFFENDTLGPIYDSLGLIKKLKKLIDHAIKKDWLVIYVRQDGDSGSIVEKQSRGWLIHPEMENENAVVLSKKKADAFYGNELQTILEKNGITRLYLAGMLTEVCIRATSQTALKEKYDTIVIGDAHSTWGSDQKSASRLIEKENQLLKDTGVIVVDSNDFLNR